MKKGLRKFLGIFMAFALVLGLVAPAVQVPVYAAGTEVEYTNDDYGGHNLTVKDGETEEQVYCIAQGRPWGKNELTHSGMRIKYAWDADPAEYNAIANAGNSLVGGPYTYALSWAIVGGAYTSDSNVRPEMKPGGEGFSPLDDMPRLAKILKNIFYYAEVDGHSGADVQDAIYKVISYGDTDTMPRGWGNDSLQAKAWSGGDIGKDTELWVYLPHPDAITKGNGKGYNITSMDQAFVRGVPHVGPKVAVYLHGIKELKGGQLKDEQFSFTISGPNIEETTKVNYGADIWFPEITFDEEGEYTYTIKEVKGDDATITYDEKEKTFTVVVTKDESGKLIASVDGKQIATSDDKKDDGTPKAGEIDGSVDKYKFVNTVGEEEEPTEGSLKTRVKVGDKEGSDGNPVEITAEEADKVTSFTDLVDYKGLVEGATYKVSGTLIEKESGEVVATADPVEKTAEKAEGTWEIEFKFEAGTLKEGKEYVVFEEATLVKDADGNDVEDGDTLEHKDPEDKAQTIVVKTPSTGDETIDIPVTKVWDDEDNAEGKRPENITVKLLANGEATDQTLVLNEENSWKGTFSDLAKTDADAKEITYSVTEDQVEYYIMTVDGDAASGFTITNASRPWVPKTPGTPGEEKYGQFSVKKTVSGGASGETSKEFSFTVSFEVPEADAYTETFTLKASDDAKVFDYLPEGTKVTITEDAGKEYTVKITAGNQSADKNTCSFTIADGDDIEVTVDNSKGKDTPPTDNPSQGEKKQGENKQAEKKDTGVKTGDESTPGLWIAVLILTALLAGAVALRSKIQKR